MRTRRAKRLVLTSSGTTGNTVDEYHLLASQTFIHHAGADLAARFAGIHSPETVHQCLLESYHLPNQGARVKGHLLVLALRFTTERLSATAQIEGTIVTNTPQVLFVCVHNAGRSQMAAALLDHHAQGKVQVRSAGSAPADTINPAVVEVMDELGIDLTKQFPKPLTGEVVQASDVVITMGCGDACPVFPGKRYLDWELTDPAGKTVQEIRPIRDEIDARVRDLLAELLPADRADQAPGYGRGH